MFLRLLEDNVRCRNVIIAGLALASSVLLRRLAGFVVLSVCRVFAFEPTYVIQKLLIVKHIKPHSGTHITF